MDPLNGRRSAYGLKRSISDMSLSLSQNGLFSGSPEAQAEPRFCILIVYSVWRSSDACFLIPCLQALLAWCSRDYYKQILGKMGSALGQSK